MSRSESALFYLSEVVVGILIEYDLTDGDEWVVSMRNNFGDIENIELVILPFFLGNDLGIPGP